MKFDLFIPALLLSILLGKFFPEPAVYEGIINLEKIGDIGISLVFLFYGIKLKLSRLKEDLANWKLHAVIQFSTFVLFPLILLPFTLWLRDSDSWLLWLGGFFMAALPSTVTSSVILVSMAKGNVPSAIFNASFSSLAGIFLTPIWMGIIIHSGQDANSSEYGIIILKLVLQVFLPVVLGLFLNRYLGKWAEKRLTFIHIFDRIVILLIVYLSFAKSFYSNQFQLVEITDLLFTSLFCLVLLFVVYQIITLICNILKFNKKEKITAQFLGSQKSLIHGTVMSKVIFSNILGVGVILLPLMIYHVFQLVIFGVIAKRKK